MTKSPLRLLTNDDGMDNCATKTSMAAALSVLEHAPSIWSGSACSLSFSLGMLCHSPSRIGAGRFLSYLDPSEMLASSLLASYVLPLRPRAITNLPGRWEMRMGLGASIFRAAFQSPLLGPGLATSCQWCCVSVCIYVVWLLLSAVSDS